MQSDYTSPNDYDCPECVDPDVLDLPPSAKLVRLALLYEGPLTQSAIVEVTGLHDRTARYGVERLKDAGLIESEVNVMDARQRAYTLNEGTYHAD